ncbi:hypothetical protein FACS189485_05000 [Spirochaetia bacterium]|nr:hypothetical protein FACS189485_05000 [Spirochaetia bacterium]
MNIAMLILTGIGALAAVVSAIFAFKANSTANNVLAKMRDTKAENSGKNSGIINGVNTGEMRNERIRS